MIGQQQQKKDMQLSSRDLYRLRHSYLMAQRAGLRAQYAQHQLQQLTLELERRYGLLTCNVVLDIRTGAISETSADSTQPDETAKPEEKG